MATFFVKLFRIIDKTNKLSVNPLVRMICSDLQITFLEAKRYFYNSSLNSTSP